MTESDEGVADADRRGEPGAANDALAGEARETSRSLLEPRGAAVVTLLLIGALALLLRFPPINDVTTTPDEPPSFRAAPPGDAPYPEAFADMQRRAYPDLAPLASSRPAVEAFALASRAAREMPSWEVVLHDDSLRVLQAVAMTRLVWFRDDVVVEVRPGSGGGEGSEVHVRSRARLRWADFGMNARRIRSYLANVRAAFE